MSERQRTVDSETEKIQRQGKYKERARYSEGGDTETEELQRQRRYRDRGDTETGEIQQQRG